MLADNAGAVPFAGGTDLLVNWPEHVEAHDRTYVDLSGLAELRPIRWTEDELILGAGTTYWDVIRDARAGSAFPLLIEAARQVGAIQIQARGTWAGNIANASPAADGVPVLMAYDAVVVLASRDGTESIPLDEFYLGYKQTRRRPEQIITRIRMPLREYSFQAFHKIGTRRAQAIARVGLAITRCGDAWRVVASSAAPTICRCPSVERFLQEQRRVNGPDDLLGPLGADLSPIDDLRSTADYRLRVLARLLSHEVLA